VIQFQVECSGHICSQKLCKGSQRQVAVGCGSLLPAETLQNIADTKYIGGTLTSEKTFEWSYGCKQCNWFHLFICLSTCNWHLYASLYHVMYGGNNYHDTWLYSIIIMHEVGTWSGNEVKKFVNHICHCRQNILYPTLMDRQPALRCN
jgi:hypothetical protein